MVGIPLNIFGIPSWSHATKLSQPCIYDEYRSWECLLRLSSFAHLTAVDICHPTSWLTQMAIACDETNSQNDSMPVPFNVLQLPSFKSGLRQPDAGHGMKGEMLNVDPIYCAANGRLLLSIASHNHLEVLEYDPRFDTWSDIWSQPSQKITFNFPISTHTMDDDNRILYLVGNGEFPPSSHQMNTVLCALDLNSRQRTLQIMKKEKKSRNYDDMTDHLIFITSSMKELHLIYSSSMRHIRIPMDNGSSGDIGRGTESFGIEVDDRFNARTQLRFAKCIHIPTVSRIFVFCGAAPKKRQKDVESDCKRSDNINSIPKKATNELGERVNPPKFKYTKNAVPSSIWYFDINRKHQKDNETGSSGWLLYDQRLPHKSRKFGVLQGFGFLLFLFYYGKSNEIWCLDLTTGQMVRSKKTFPIRCKKRMRMCSTSDGKAHFILMHQDLAWICETDSGSSDIELYGYERSWNLNLITKQSSPAERTGHLPNDIVDADDYGKVRDPSKECNFHIAIDLLDVVPNVIRMHHKQRYSDLIQKFTASEGISFPDAVIYLLCRFISALPAF